MFVLTYVLDVRICAVVAGKPTLLVDFSVSIVVASEEIGTRVPNGVIG
jgi:hypothetical protein